MCIRDRSYTFRLLTPVPDANAPLRVMSAEASAVGVRLVPDAPRARLVTVTFPSTGTPNSDNYVPATVRFSVAPVSYTHLRAHETVLDLVCRLLLEKKKETQVEITVYSKDSDIGI